jgi:hypothetical protein
MSGNRANSSAVNRRTNAPQAVQQPPKRQQSNPGMNRNTSSRTSKSAPVQAPPTTVPKISISDAMGLVSLRLGRVETILSSMPSPESLVGSGSVDRGGDEDSFRVVDEAVFQSIVSRLDVVEKRDSSNQDVVDLKESIKTLTTLYESLKTEIGVTKELVMTVQNVAMQTSQKLIDMVVPEKKGGKSAASTAV